MSESKAALPLDLPEAIEIELSHKALKLAVPEKLGGDFSLHQLGVKDIDVGLGGVPGDDFLEFRVLS